MRTRIAPTPSGFLHLGNAVNIAMVVLLARKHEGSIVLRVDDLDPQMVVADAVEDIFATLRWLGVNDYEGPRTAADLADHWSQRHRVARYDSIVQRLHDAGHLFACTCTRREIVMRQGAGEYDGHCLHANLDLATSGAAWRLRHSVQGLPYPVIRTKAGLPSYQVASLADDIHFGITHIVRGQDLEPSTRIQRRIASLLAPNHPFVDVTIYHHPLVTDAHGGKLSKSQGAMGVRERIAAGAEPDDVYTMARTMLEQLTAD